MKIEKCLIAFGIIFFCNSMLLSMSGRYSLLDTLMTSIEKIDEGRIIKAADKILKEEPVTITSFASPRSSGGIHDFFSEGDYWWPDTTNPNGPYVQRDGFSNPDNFSGHRKALIRFSIQAASLTAAYKITGDKRYAIKAIDHLKAWFITEKTKMNPHLLYSQAIKGRYTGRGIGIVDAIHFIEIAKSVMILDKGKLLSVNELMQIKKWFSDYLEWVTTHQYGKDEMEAKNNHGTWWVTQVSMFAKLTGDTAKMNFCKNRFKEILLPNQMAPDGSFPLELKRTKPYNYSLFNLDGMALICKILSDEKENLWLFTLPDGRNMKKGIEFMYPFIKDKSKWLYPQDVMYYEFYPVRQPALLFGGEALNESKFVDLWKTLNADQDNEEVIRNFPVRQPVLWIE